MTEEVLPVLIIGGGPVGLALAEELAFHGVRVTVVEPRVVVDHSRPRAKTTSVRTMEHFRRWGIADRLRDVAPLSSSWSQRVTFVQTVTGREITHLDGCLGLEIGPELSPEPAQQVTQPIVEEVLRADLARKNGVELLFGWRAVEAKDGPNHAEVVIANEAGEHRGIAALWVVGADGARSIVRGVMGARYEGSADGRPNVNITFRSAELADLIPHPQSIHYWVLNPDSPGVVGPLDHTGTWWAISTGTAEVQGVDHAAQIVRSLVGADVDVEVLATDPWQARMLLADRYRSGRLFIVGDAAHQNPPWGGHGFNTVSAMPSTWAGNLPLCLRAGRPTSFWTATGPSVGPSRSRRLRWPRPTWLHSRSISAIPFCCRPGRHSRPRAPSSGLRSGG